MMTRLPWHSCARRLLAVLVLGAGCETAREVRPVLRAESVAGASCLGQAVTTQTVSGVQTAAFTNTSLADNTGIDAPTAQGRTTAPISVPLGGGANECFAGGETLRARPPPTGWGTA